LQVGNLTSLVELIASEHYSQFFRLQGTHSSPLKYSDFKHEVVFRLLLLLLHVDESQVLHVGPYLEEQETQFDVCTKYPASHVKQFPEDPVKHPGKAA